MKKIGLFVGVMTLLMAFGFAGQAKAGSAYVGTGLDFSFPGFSGDVGQGNEGGGFSWEYLHLGYDFTDNVGVNLLWGQAAGTGKVSAFGFSQDVDWTTDYLDLNFRYTAKMKSVSPYFEAGLGMYTMDAKGGHVDADLDPVLGYRLGVGAAIPISNFYVAPELSYHWAEFDQGKAHISGLGSFDINNTGRGDFGLLSLKLGYRFGK